MNETARTRNTTSAARNTGSCDIQPVDLPLFCPFPFGILSLMATNYGQAAPSVRRLDAQKGLPAFAPALHPGVSTATLIGRRDTLLYRYTHK